MSVNEEIVDQFKKSLSAAVKSIGKSQEIEVDFIDDEPSIDGNKINLKIPNISSIKNNINYLRAEADSLALEARLHDSKIHQKYISYNNIGDKIFKAIEKSRIEANGSKIFKGVKLNIFDKHNIDINKLKINNESDKFIVEAFKYVSYCELTNQKLKGNYVEYKKLVKQKLGSQYDSYFNNLRKYKFVVCPEGNGPDTHRTWEALLLNTVPIFKLTKFTENLNNSGIPGIYLNNWEDLSK